MRVEPILRRAFAPLVAAAVIALCGCEKTPAHFQLNTKGVVPPDTWYENQLEGLQAEISDGDLSSAEIQERRGRLQEEYDTLVEQRGQLNQQLVDALVGLFGTPNRPYVGADTGLDMRKIALASGRTGTDNTLLITKKGDVFSGRQVGEDEDGNIIFYDEDDNYEYPLPKGEIAGTYLQKGLYREHCVHCHGITGDGLGPTARFLRPYPRDFRLGKFKFISTHQANEKATRGDLRRTLDEGIFGTAMPSFRLLPENELDALIEYVIYLSMRGETENYIRKLGATEADFFEDPDFAREQIQESYNLAVSGWQDLEAKVVEVPPRPKISREEAIKLGKALFFDQKRTKCAGCHGQYALGDGQVQVDIWNEGKVDTVGDKFIPNPDKEKLYPLPLQRLNPRNLRMGIFRGGRRKTDLYRRLHVGIVPSKMPAFGQTLKPEEIWYLVEYVLSLQYEDKQPAGGDHHGHEFAQKRP